MPGPHIRAPAPITHGRPTPAIDQDDGRPREGERLVLDAPRSGARHPQGTPSRHPQGTQKGNMLDQCSAGFPSPSHPQAPAVKVHQRGRDGSPHPHAGAHSKWAADFDPDRPPRRQAAQGGRNPPKGRPPATTTGRRSTRFGCWAPTPTPPTPWTRARWLPAPGTHSRAGRAPDTRRPLPLATVRAPPPTQGRPPATPTSRNTPGDTHTNGATGQWKCPHSMPAADPIQPLSGRAAGTGCGDDERDDFDDDESQNEPWGMSVIVAWDVLLFAVVFGEGGDSLRAVRGEDGVVSG